MKFLFKVFFPSLLIIIITASLTFKLNLLGKPIEFLINTTLNKQSIFAQVKHLKFNSKGLFIKDIFITLSNNYKLTLKDVKITWSFHRKKRKLSLIVKTKINNLIINNKDNNIERIFKVKILALRDLNLLYCKRDYILEINHLNKESSLITPSNTFNIYIKQSDGSILNHLKTLDCKIYFSDKTLLNFNSKLQNKNIIVNGTFTNINMSKFSFIGKFLDTYSKNSFIEYPSSALIKAGSFKLNLDKRFLSNHNVLSIKGLLKKFTILINFLTKSKYYQNDEQIKFLLKGCYLEILLDKCYIDNTTINTKVVLDCLSLNYNDAYILVDCITKGPIEDFVKAISKLKTEKFLLENNIKVQHFNGHVNSRIYTKKYYSSNKIDIFNINAEVKGAQFKLFNNFLKFSQGNFKINFNGKYLSIDGDTFVNKLKSKIKCYYDFLGEDFKLDGVILLTNQLPKLKFIKILSGNSTLYLEYRNRRGKGSIKAKSDLKNLEFYLEKISIHKKVGDIANLLINSKFYSTIPNKINLSIFGDKSFNIICNISILPNYYKLHFPIINYLETNLSSTILISKSANIQARVYGNSLDLSEVNLINFFNEEKRNVRDNFQFNINKVKLKNNITLKNFQLQLKPKNTNSSSCYIKSEIGEKSLIILLDQIQDYKKLIISCNDAGSFLKGISLYNNMYQGSMLIIANITKNKSISDIVGKFFFTKFTTVDRSFLAGLISYLSLPGIQNIISNTKGIEFKEMKGIFSYNNKIIKISNTKAEGPYFDFTMDGFIDTQAHRILLKGGVNPSIYGINSILQKMPILGKLLSIGYRKGFFLAPYYIKRSY